MQLDRQVKYKQLQQYPGIEYRTVGGWRAREKLDGHLSRSDGMIKQTYHEKSSCNAIINFEGNCASIQDSIRLSEQQQQHLLTTGSLMVLIWNTSGGYAIYHTFVGRAEILTSAFLDGARIDEVAFHYKVSVNGADADGGTPLTKASASGRIEDVELLISKGANMNATNKNGNTALHTAAQNGHAGVIKMLTSKAEARVCVNSMNKVGATPLQLAAYYGRAEAIKMLVKKGACWNAEKWSALHWAVNHGHVAATRMLIATGADVNAKYNYSSAPDLYDSFSGFRSGDTPLHVAAKLGRAALIEMLLAKGANVHSVNDDGDTALHLAAQANHSIGSNRNAAKFTAVRTLIAHGSDVNRKNNKGATPLRLAAMGGFLQSVDILITNGATAHPDEGIHRELTKQSEIYGVPQVLKVLAAEGMHDKPILKSFRTWCSCC